MTLEHLFVSALSAALQLRAVILASPRPPTPIPTHASATALRTGTAAHSAALAAGQGLLLKTHSVVNKCWETDSIDKPKRRKKGIKYLQIKSQNVQNNLKFIRNFSNSNTCISNKSLKNKR